MVYALCVDICDAYVYTVWLTFIPLFSDKINVLFTGHSLEQVITVPPYFMSRCTDDVMGQQLNHDENCLSEWESNPQPSEQL